MHKETDTIVGNLAEDVKSDARADETTARPGKVSGALWGPRGARTPTSERQDQSLTPETP